MIEVVKAINMTLGWGIIDDVRVVSIDTSFPFKVGENVTVKIDGKRLITEKRKQ